MSGRAAPALRTRPAAAGLLLGGLVAWVAVLRGAADFAGAATLAALAILQVAA
jgi:hypothetical protein